MAKHSYDYNDSKLHSTGTFLVFFFSVASQKLALQTRETVVHGGIFRPPVFPSARG